MFKNNIEIRTYYLTLLSNNYVTGNINRLIHIHILLFTLTRYNDKLINKI